MRLVFLTIGLALLAQPAFADVQDYCAAVARDFADLRPKDRDIWQTRYDDANADCVEQFSTAPQVVATKPKVQVVQPGKPEPVAEPVVAAVPVVKAKKRAAKVATTTTSVEGSTAEVKATAAPARRKPTPGSAEWTDYCSRKYSSFNRDKGTYTSKTGVERRCIVTSDFFR
jgi:BA14K-like protein